MTMRKRLSTIWLALFLLPYLCFSVIGDLPHQHGRHGLFQPWHQTLQAAVPTAGSAIVANPGSDGDDAEHCPLCQVQAALSACAAISVTLDTLPVIAALYINTEQHLTIRSLSSPTSARAPPVSLS